MGLSGSKTTNTYTPNPAQTQAASNLSSVYAANQGNTQQITNTLSNLIPGVASQIGSTSQGVGAASGYYQDVLGGKYLSPDTNPYLSAMMTQNDNAIRDQVNGSFSAAGRTGSGANAYALAKGIGEANNSLLSANYSAERATQSSAAANAGTLNSQTLASLLGLSTTAAGLPLEQAAQYASGIGSLGLGGTQTTQTSPSLGAVLGQMLANGAAAAKYSGA